MRRGEVGEKKVEAAKSPEARRPPRIRRPRLSRETYKVAWEAYRDCPTQAAVREAADIGGDIALRLINVGIPELALPPLSKRLKDENRLAVASEKRLEDAGERLDAEKARLLAEAQTRAAQRVLEKEKSILHDAAASREEELRLVRVNRQSALAIAGVGARLLKSSARLAETLEEALDEAAKEGLTGSAALRSLGLKPAHVVGMVARIAQTAEKVASVSRDAVEMERLIMGEPTQILGVQRGQDSGDVKDYFAAALRIAKDRAERQRMASLVIDAVLVAKREDVSEDDSPKLVDDLPADPEEDEAEEVSGGEALPE